MATSRWDYIGCEFDKCKYDAWLYDRKESKHQQQQTQPQMKLMNFVSGQLLSGATRSIANSKDFCASSPHVSEVSYSEHELDITRCPFQEVEDACRFSMSFFK